MVKFRNSIFGTNRANERILGPKTAFDTSGLEISEYAAKCYLNVTDDVTGRIKGQFFEYLQLFASPGKAAVSDWSKANPMERHGSYLGYLYPPKSFVTLCQFKVIQGHVVK